MAQCFDCGHLSRELEELAFLNRNWFGVLLVLLALAFPIDARSSSCSITVRFSPSSFILVDGDHMRLKSYAEKVIEGRSNIRISGHFSAGGTREYELGMSERAARQVADILAQHGIDESRMSTVGYGHEWIGNESAKEHPRSMVKFTLDDCELKET